MRLSRTPLAAITLTTLLTACSDDGTDSSATQTTAPTSVTNVTGMTTGGTDTTGAPTSSGSATDGTMSGTGPGPTTGTATTGTATTDSSTTVDITATSTGTSTTGTSDGTTSTGTTSTDTSSTTDGPCAPGTIICEGNTKKVCDGMGGFSEEEQCPDVCVPGLGCTACDPGSFQCNGDNVEQCDAMGQGWNVVETCDGLQGITCDDVAGQCEGECAPANLGLSYIGCDYYPVPLAGLQETNPWVFNYAVVVANTTADTANITITRGAMNVANDTVGPNTAKVITLPYVNGLNIPAISNAGPTVMVADGAYRLRSDRPVTVYQYNPLQYQVGNSFSYINDAGLLFPVNTWGSAYRVAARNHWTFQAFQLPGYYAVIAREDNTQVTLTPSATGGKVFAGAGVAANGTGQVTLNQGDVLEVFTSANGGQPDTSDLTGTLVEATKPVQVIGGHKCTNVPYNIQFCDRLEESIPSIDTLAKEYIVTAPLINANTVKGEMVRIIATEAATSLTYEPNQPGAPTFLANAGDYAEIAQTQASFRITGDKKILVTQYMLGQNAGGNAGDPAMTFAVATQQFRSQYLVHAPTNYSSSFANLVAPMGATVTVDGMNIANFTAIGATGYGVARVPLSNAGDGNHYMTGTMPFGVQIYGYGQYTSYWYPGGLNLDLIPQ